MTTPTPDKIDAILACHGLVRMAGAGRGRIAVEHHHRAVRDIASDRERVANAVRALRAAGFTGEVLS